MGREKTEERDEPSKSKQEEKKGEIGRVSECA